VLGPTAAGKSGVAMILAERTGAEIVSVDSMQVYRGMDVGTAKPTADDQARVRHHMIDVVDPSEAYSVAEFRNAARAAIADSGRPILVVGGSGLHFRSLVDPLDFAPTDPDVREAMASEAVDDLIEELTAADPDAADHVDLANPRRVERAVEVLRITGETPTERASTPRAAAVRAYEPEVPVVAVGLDPGDGLAGRVERRFDRMLERGLVDEVERLAPNWGETASRAVGYRQIARVVAGEWDLASGRRRSIDATTALSHRQRTWFRRDPRIEWLEWDDDPVRVADAALRRFEEAGWTS
jgi:tRNA dimethylallyltransferase